MDGRASERDALSARLRASQPRGSRRTCPRTRRPASRRSGARRVGAWPREAARAFRWSPVRHPGSTLEPHRCGTDPATAGPRVCGIVHVRAAGTRWPATSQQRPRHHRLAPWPRRPSARRPGAQARGAPFPKRRAIPTVMAGLVPATHAEPRHERNRAGLGDSDAHVGVGGRDKPGHDEAVSAPAPQRFPNDRHPDPSPRPRRDGLGCARGDAGAFALASGGGFTDAGSILQPAPVAHAPTRAERP